MRKKWKLAKYSLFWRRYKWIYWDLVLLLAHAVCVAAGQHGGTPQLAQVTYELTVLIGTSFANVALKPLIYANSRLFLLSEVSPVLITMSHAAAGNFIYYLSGQTEWRGYSQNSVFLISNIGFYIVLVVCFLFLIKKREDEDSDGVTPPKTPLQMFPS